MNESDLANKGFIQLPNGEWYKPTVGQPAARLDSPQCEHREIQTLACRPSKQASRNQSPRKIHCLIVRIGRRELDSDNLVGSAKSCRDAIARKLGLDDADRRIEFQYGQVTTKGSTKTLVIVTMK